MFDRTEVKTVDANNLDEDDLKIIALTNTVGRIINGFPHEVGASVLSMLLVDVVAQPCDTIEEAEAGIKVAAEGMAEHLKAIWPSIVEARKLDQMPPMLPAGNA